MNRRSRNRKFVAALLWVVVVPLLVVGFKYWQWERTLHADETGHGFSVPLHSSTYAGALEALYLPTKSFVQPLFRHLRVVGVAIDLLADLLAVALQHAVLLLLWNAWHAHRLSKSVTSPEDRSET
jgi:hypothetical protein